MNHTRRISLALSPILGLAAAALLTACSTGGPPTAQPASSSSSGATSGAVAPTASAQASAPDGVPAGLASLPGLGSAGGETGDQALALLPASFPLPPRASGVDGTTADGTTGVVFNVPDGSGVVSFYRRALPAAGFPLTSDSLGFPVGFTGTGVTRGLIAVSGNAVGVSIYGTFTAGGRAGTGSSGGSGNSGGSGGAGGGSADSGGRALAARSPSAIAAASRRSPAAMRPSVCGEAVASSP